MDRLAITFDIDWAPDWCIDVCADMCRSAGVSATFFCTHACDAVEALKQDPLFEVGIHPNFLPGSSHGTSATEVVDYCLELVPDARCMRTHALVQSTPIYDVIMAKYPQIRTDVSLFLPFHPDLRPTSFYFGDSKRGLTRLPYYWEDDIAAVWPGWSWENGLSPRSGLRIFDFHPIHVALNMARVQSYSELKRYCGQRTLSGVGRAELTRFIHHGAGTATFLKALLQAAQVQSCRKISEIADEFHGLETGVAAVA